MAGFLFFFYGNKLLKECRGSMGKKEVHLGMNVLRLTADSSNTLYVSIQSSMESKQYMCQGWPARRASGAALDESYRYSSSLMYGSNTTH